MAWNEPGNRGESPWGKKRPAGKTGGLEQTLKEMQQKLQAALGGGGGEPPAGGAAQSPGGGLGMVLAVVLVLLWLASGLFQIEASDIGVVQRFGRYSAQKQPGFGWAFPWPIERVTKVNVSS